MDNFTGVKYVDGLMIPPFMHEEALFTVRDTAFRPNDIIIVTYPKSGTNWISYIIWCLVHPEEPAPDGDRVMEDVLFADMYGLGKWAESPEDQTRTFVTHMPYDRVGKITSAKYVVMIRNPMDVFISYYHFAPAVLNTPYNEGGAQEVSTEAFNNFVTGNVIYGSHLQHLKSWYAHKERPNVFFAVYEKMKENPRREILRLAKFLGREKVLEDNDGVVLDKILEISSFSAMKKHVKYSLKLLDGINSIDLPILRKGEAGGYRNALTPSQIEQLKDLMEKELEGTEILEYWRNI